MLPFVALLMIGAVSAVAAGVHLRQPCVTSEQCPIDHSVCDAKVKRCFCATGYGISDQSDDTCRKLPFYNQTLTTFETDSQLNCEVLSSNSTEIVWLLNGNILCEHATQDYVNCSQDKNTTYVDELYTYSRRLQVKNVLKSDNYVCMAVEVETGRNWTVFETQIVVLPKEFTTVRINGSDDTIYCNVATPNLLVRLYHDDGAYCTSSSPWCLQRNGTGGSNTFFDIKNLRRNHIFICMVYTSDMKQPTTASVHHLTIVPKTEIYELTVSPPGPVPNGRELVATARFQSSFGVPVRHWMINGELITNQDELIFLSKDVYRSTVSLGPILSSSIVSLEIITNYGSDTKKFKVGAVDLLETKTTTASWNSTRTSGNVTFSPTTNVPSATPARTMAPMQPGDRSIYIKDSNNFNIFVSPVKRQE